MDGRKFEVYAHGSYKNDTNVRADASVNVVVQDRGTISWEANGLEERDRAACLAALGPCAQSLGAFDADVERALRSRFGFERERVHARNRCLTVAAGSGRLAVDVVVAAEHRRYRRFKSILDQQFTEGITFWGRDDHAQVVDYPNLHFANGVRKNAATQGRFKPSVRMFKNAALYLIGARRLACGTAPSYFVESLLFNAPNAILAEDSDETFYNVLTWLDECPDWSVLVCQHCESHLFGPTARQWDVSNARRFHGELVRLWNEWC